MSHKMGNFTQLVLLLSALLASVLSAPHPFPQDQPGPFALIGNFIQRLQTSFNEGSDSIKISNNAIPLSLSATNGTTTTTTTTTTTAPPTTKPLFRPSTNPFDSINAILDNIGRSASSNNNKLDSGNNNNIFGSVPGRNLLDSPFTTPRPLPPLTTSRSPFDLEGINQGINAFFQAFIKTNIEKLFRPGQDQQQHSITTRRSDPPQQLRQLSFGEAIINSLFKKNY